MGERRRDPLKEIFDRAATRLNLSGRRREVAWLYFRGTPRKAICVVGRIAEGTMKCDLVSLHGRLGTSSRVDFVHRIYGIGGTGSSRISKGTSGRSVGRGGARA